MILPSDIEDLDPDQKICKTLSLMIDGRGMGMVTVDFASRCWKLGRIRNINPMEWEARQLSNGGVGWKQRLVDEAIAGLRESAK
jgi:hypothetical protein